MTTRHELAVTGAVLCALTVLLPGASSVSAEETGMLSTAAIPELIGGEDIFGAYDVAVGWPKDIAELPGHEGWTWGPGQSIFAESPDRVFALMRGELPNVKEPKPAPLVGSGQSKLLFPVRNLPWRSATTVSPPMNGAPGSAPEDGVKVWLEAGNEFGVDARWEHCILVFDREGNLIEDWSQWDSMLQRPHFIGISPYDPEKHVWVIDDHKHAIYIFTNDGKKLVRTIGTVGVAGADGTHFNRPAMVDWLPDGTFFVADGYNGSRVAKFDADGNFLLDWGQPGRTGPGYAGGGGVETRPGYFNNLHSLAVHAETRRVFVNDRSNKRVQVFDEFGKYLYEWSFGTAPSDVRDFRITADGYLWAASGTNKMLKYDLDGHFLYSWGTFGTFPGGMWGVHGISSDQDGNFYVAEVDKGGFQKYVPRKGANPDMLVGPPVRSAWK